jgi:hypothetical protein
MRLESIRIRNLGPFGEATLDLRDTAGPLVAVTGANGAEKTSLLELFGGALFRECHTRGSLASLATARNMFEVNDYARRWLATRVVDRFVAQATSGGAVPNAGALMTTIAFGLRDLVLQRWEAGGGDLNLSPLTAQHVARKVALGYPTRIGTMTGQSLKALRSAQPIARRAG